MPSPTTTYMSGRTPVQVESAPAIAGPTDDLPPTVAAPAAKVDEYLRAYIDSTELPANLKSAILYSLLGPGKRARPLLAWHSFVAVDASGADPARVLPAAGAAELIHSFSLVHDDLPGLDNDDLRRGRPTLHKHTSEAMAVLAGDSMLTLAFQLLTERIDDRTIAARLCGELALGTNGMIAGQVYDTLGGFEPNLTDAQKLRTIHSHKTGMLIRASCRMGAICAGADAAALAAITRYAEDIGLMFQIVDDLLDVTQSTAHLGKRAGKDQEAGKLTYPGIMGIEPSRQEVERLHTESLQMLEMFGARAEPLRHLATSMARRTR
mgnify:CR=1 FL=1